MNRTRGLYGALALILFSLFYYWFVITVAIMRLPGLDLGWHLLFYFLSVVVWFIPAAMIVRWMQRAR